MIKLSKIISEIKPTTISFKSGKELANFINQNKEEFVSFILKKMDAVDEAEWGYVRKGWIKNPCYPHPEIPEVAYLDNDEEDILYMSILKIIPTNIVSPDPGYNPGEWKPISFHNKHFFYFFY